MRHRRKGMRFAAPFPTDQTDASFRRFVTAASGAHNAWPQSVPTLDPAALRQAWAEPLLKTFYLPSTAQGLMLKLRDHLSPELGVGVIHEGLHLALDFTPAKELGRLCLAQAHRLVGELLFSEGGWGDREAAIWAELQRANDLLATTCERIVLAEELLVTSVGFTSMEMQQVERDSLDSALALADFEALAVAEQGHALWGALEGSGRSFEEFEATYWRFRRAFKEVAFLLVKEHGSTELAYPGPVFAQLAIYLESLEFDVARLELIDELPDDAGEAGGVTPTLLLEVVRAIDSRERCERLVEFVETRKPTTCGQLAEWLDQDRELLGWLKLVDESSIARDFADDADTLDYDRVTWLFAASASVALAQASFPARQVVEFGSRQHRSDTFADDADPGDWGALLIRQRSHAPGLTSSSWLSGTRFYPREVDGGWLVAPELLPGTLPGELSVLALCQEAWRQQLDERVGMRCPIYAFAPGEGKCWCKENAPEWRERALRLTRWAKDEHRFGEGDWTHAPGPCGSDA